MIAIDNVLLSDEIVQEQFVCDLQKCKGGCCVDGDCGAPLTFEETKILADVYPKMKHLLLPEYAAVIDNNGTHTMDNEFGFVTPTVNGGICAYGYTEATGVVKCGIEKAYKDGLINFYKPISCHLYPIRIKETKDYEIVNYEPRKSLCKPACKLGKQLQVPVYVFLKAPLIRKYGEEFYEALEAVAEKMDEDSRA